MEPEIYETRADWLAARRRGVGASDVPAIVGVSPYASALSVWIDKTRPPEEDDSEVLTYGREMEGAVLARFARESGKCLGSHPLAIWRSERWPWMFCTPDAWCCDENSGVEAKTILPYGWDGELPTSWELQAQAQMAVMGWDRVYIPTYDGGRRFQVFEVERDQGTIGEIADLTKSFWDMVESGTMPEPGHLDAQALSRYFPPVDAVMVLSDEDVATIDRIRHLTTIREIYDEELETAKNRLRARLGSATAGEKDGEMLVTWRPDAKGTRRLRIL